MKPPAAPPLGDEHDEIPALIETLLAAEERLEQLTAGEVDTVAGRDGRTFLLRRAQEQLHRGQAGKQAAILNALPVHIALLDTQGVIVSVNDTWRHFTGAHVLQGPGYAIGFNYLAACDQAGGVSALEAQQVASGIRAVLAGTSRMFSLEYACAMPTGRLWFLLTVTPMHADRLRGAVVRQLDITDRKRAESERERFFTLSVDLLCIAGFDGHFQRVNPAFTRMLGYTEAELHAQPLVEFIHPDDRAPTLAEFGRLESGALTLNFENRYRCKDGTYRWILWNAVPFAADSALYAVGHDITGRKLAQEALERQQTELRVLFDLVPALILLKDTQNRLLRVNQRVADAVGRTVEEMEGRPTSEFFPDLAARYHTEDLTVINSGVPELGVVQATLTPAGNPQWVQTDKVPLRDPSGKVVGILVMAQDITERMQNEESLREKNALIRIASRITRTGGWALELPSQRVFWADEVFDIFEYPLGDELSLDMALAMYPDHSRPRISALIEECARNGTPFDIEIEAVTALRRPIWARVRGEAERRTDGSILRVHGAFQDITERRRSEEILHLLRSAVEQSTESILITDAQLDLPGPRIVFVNPAFTRMTGYTAADVIGLTPRILQGPHTDRAVMQRLRDNLQHGQVFRGQAINYRKDGEEFPLEWEVAPIRDAQGVVTHFVALQRDIAERKTSEMALQRFRALLDQSNDTLEVVDPETGRFIDVNDRGCTTHGYTREEFLKLTVSDINPAISPAEWLRVRDGIQLRGFRSAEGVRRRKDGTTFPVEFSSKWVRLDRDYIVSVVRDTTERKASEERLLHAQRIENIGMLAAGVAHDLNNILAPMLMAASILQSRITDEGDRRMLVMVETSAQRGAALVRQILSFSQASGGEQQVLQVKHLLRDIAMIVQETFPKSLTFVEEIDSELWTILADVTQIHQVLLNLCINARDAMPGKGTLTLRAANCRLDEAAARTLEGASAGNWLKLEVSDTGTGIPPEVLAHIWEPFFTTKAPGKGTGLGLSTVRGIVERHLGFINVQTQPGRGTTFSLYLPTAEGSTRTEPGLGSVSDGHGELILVVEDEESMREIINEMLTLHHYRVMTAADGIGGIALVAKHGLEIRLVITDFNMPGLTGEGFARVARALNATVKILGMSGGDEGRKAAVGTDPFADAFLVKPFTPQDLLLQVQRLLAPTPP